MTLYMTFAIPKSVAYIDLDRANYSRSHTGTVDRLNHAFTPYYQIGKPMLEDFRSGNPIPPDQTFAAYDLLATLDALERINHHKYREGEPALQYGLERYFWVNTIEIGERGIRDIVTWEFLPMTGILNNLKNLAAEDEQEARNLRYLMRATVPYLSMHFRTSDPEINDIYTRGRVRQVAYFFHNSAADTHIGPVGTQEHADSDYRFAEKIVKATRVLVVPSSARN